MNQDDIIKHLSLVEHVEGGYFSETYRSPVNIPTEREESDRSILTSIYYLLTSDRPIDRWHKNKSDILHYFQAGDPISYLMLSPAGELTKATLGLNFAAGEVAQLVVPGGYWKAAVLKTGDFGLLGESVAPGFDYRDMKLGTAEYFQSTFPQLWQELAPYVKTSDD